MNQNTAPESESSESIASSVATGQRLREMRESLGLTRENVAQELRLNEKLISALEEGDRSKLPPVTYIGGYLRAYARLLGLPAEQLVNEYLHERVEPSLYRTTDRSGMPILSSRDPKFRYTTFIVIAGLLLLFTAWWGSQNFTVDSLTQIQSGTADEEPREIEAKLPESMPLYQEQELSAEQAAGADQQSIAPSQVTPSGSASAPTNVPSTTAASTASPAAAVMPEAPASEVAQETPKLPQPAPVVIAEPLKPSTPQALLVMEYQAASWTQVQDADGRVLVYEVVNPGRTLELRGVAPFKVFLGYSPGVLVYYNGILFPHADYQRGDLARFRVGARADNRPLNE